MEKREGSDFPSRLDERVIIIESIVTKLDDTRKETEASRTSRLDGYERRLDGSIEKLRTTVKDSYVRRESFDPIQRIIYGLVGLILTTVVGMVIAMVVSSPR